MDLLGFIQNFAYVYVIVYSDFSAIADDVTSHVALTQIVLSTLIIVIRSVDCVLRFWHASSAAHLH